VVRWTAEHWQEIEAARDDIMRGTGTTEDWFREFSNPVLGHYAISVNYRKPLRVDEVNQMRQTVDVKQRRGRA
jgi:hypothetical protein